MLRLLLTWACRRRLRRISAKLDRLSRRMGGLQMGSAEQLFSTVPGLSNIATGGLGLRQGLQAIGTKLATNEPVTWTRVADVLAEYDTFIADANLVLDAYDKPRARDARMFVVRKEARGLF